MKRKIIFFIAILLTALMFQSCQRERYKDILADRIQYDVPVNQADPDLNWWVNNLEGSHREPFIKRIMDAAKNGDIQVYDYFNKPLTIDEVNAIGVDTIYTSLTRTQPPYDEYDTMVIKRIEYRDISKIRFLEEWKWNPKSLEMNKRIIGFGPVFVRQLGEDSYNQLLFWIYLDKEYPDKLIK